ncbi:hypothetical protein GMSM_11360 [Geomonas sp. Red276]
MDWKDGYITGIEYVHGVYRELAPSVLNMALLLQSLEPIPLQEGFTYCDLGCGQGESVNLFAACHPEGRFHAVDFNAAHIAGARTLASRTGLKNTTFWEASFSQLESLALPDFDFVVMHGIYSWVGEENRRYIREFLRKKLKTGGVVYLSYNSLPGWSPHAPLRQLLSSYADSQSGTLEQRVERAVAFAERLKEAGIALFDSGTSTREFFEYLCTLPRNYIAHEFFNREWTPYYHADVVRELAPAGLAFAGAANFVDHQDMLRFSQVQQEILDEVTDRVLRETLKDFTACPMLRRDIFTKGRPRLTPEEQVERFRAQRLALVVPQGSLERKALFPVGEVLFDRELYDPILAALDERPQTLDQLMQRDELASLRIGRVVEALLVLLSAEYLMPAVEPLLLATIAAKNLNAALLDRELNNLEKLALASPVVQNGLKLEWLERLLIACQSTGAGRDPVPWIWDNMKAHNHKLSRDGEVLMSEEENLAELHSQAETFRKEKLPLLRKLGIV